jgi:hypothetical protein
MFNATLKRERYEFLNMALFVGPPYYMPVESETGRLVTSWGLFCISTLDIGNH